MPLNLLVLKTHQLHQLADFYRLLGCTFVYHQHGQGPLHYACEEAGFVFEIYPLKENHLVDTSTRLGFKVANLDALMHTLSAHNINIVRPAKQTAFGYVAVVKDLDGRTIELTQSD